ncbi:MAG: hypothetical protein KC733_06415, partial [Candidatus Omnitrophica bacterium]|nr:hypothetical protein [Candidatus Omnitrophota bacterium]
MFKKIIYLLLTLACGILILSPLLDFQYFLSPGDHGRELFAFKKTMDGAAVYKDFSWMYGLLM